MLNVFFPAAVPALPVPVSTSSINLGLIPGLGMVFKNSRHV